MKKSISTITSLLLSIAFIGIILFIMICGAHVFDSDNSTGAAIFTAIDSFLLLLIVGFGKPIFKTIGIGMYAPVCVVTLIYSLIAMGSTILLFESLSVFAFTAVKLIALFIFFCIIIPLSVIGSNTKRDEDTRPEVKKHNLN